MSKLKWAAVVFLLATTVLLAQDTPKADIAIDYSHLQVLKGYTISMNGGSGSAAFNLRDWLGLAADFGGYHGYPSQSLTGETFTFGPRFTYRRFPRLEPFAEGLIGGSHFNANSGGISGGERNLHLRLASAWTLPSATARNLPFVCSVITFGSVLEVHSQSAIAFPLVLLSVSAKRSARNKIRCEIKT